MIAEIQVSDDAFSSEETLDPSQKQASTREKYVSKDDEEMGSSHSKGRSQGGLHRTIFLVKNLGRPTLRKGRMSRLFHFSCLRVKICLVQRGLCDDF